MNGGNPAGVWVSWANWGWDDKGESCSYLNPGSCDAHNWGSHSASGSHVDGYLKAAGPSGGSTTPAPPPAPGTCQTFPGQNNNGVNFESTARHASSPGECCNACKGASGCKGYTHIEANSKCWLKSSLGSLTSDSYATSGSYSPELPTTTAAARTTAAPTPSSPTVSPSQDCPGGSLQSCIGACPEDILEVCTHECDERCGGSACGSDDGASLSHCVSHCPSDGFQKCVGCCEDKFSSATTVAPTTTTVPQCGNDDGASLSHCVSHCPTDGDEFHDCVICCSSKFPSAFEV